MIRTKKTGRRTLRLSRRCFLRGAGGVLLALPMLEFALPRGAQAQGVGPAKRFVAVGMENGTHPDVWHPQTQGSGWETRAGTAPLDPIREHIMLVTGLHQRAIRSPGGIEHNNGIVNVFTSRPWLSEDTWVSTGPSLDQVVAHEIGHETPFASLVMTPNQRAPKLRSSWVRAGEPSPLIVGPRALLTTIFPGGGGQDHGRELERRRRLLDLVAADASALKKKLGTHDRQRLDEHLTAVEEVEERALRLQQRRQQCQQPQLPAELDELEKRQRWELMVDLFTLALRCDLTRVGTFQFGYGPKIYRTAQDPNSPLLTDHEASHLDAEIIGRTTATKMGWMAYLVRALERAQEVDGSSLLDHTLVYINNDVSHGNQHDFDDMPIVLAGRAGGAMRSGLHLRFADEPVARLHTTLLKLMGIEATSFGLDGEGWLAGLAA